MWGQWRNIAKEAAARSLLVAKFLCLLHVTDTYLLSTSIVHGPSMLPTLNMRGDVVLMNKLSHRFGKVEAGDVVFVKSPQNPSRVLTKRVLGLEGDVVSFDSRFGISDSVVVPKGHIWIQGDNIYASNDSRHFGAVPYGLIQGKAMCRVCSILGLLLYCINQLYLSFCCTATTKDYAFCHRCVIPTDMAACRLWYVGAVMHEH